MMRLTVWPNRFTVKWQVAKNSLGLRSFGLLLVLLSFIIVSCGKQRPARPRVGVPQEQGESSSIQSLVDGLKLIKENPTEREDERVQRFLWLDAWIARLEATGQMRPDLGEEFSQDLTAFVKEPPLSERWLRQIVERASTSVGRNIANYHLYLETLKGSSVQSALAYLERVQEDPYTDLYNRSQQLLNLQTTDALAESRKIGVLLPLSGELRAFGEQVLHAVQVAAELAFADGVEFLIHDQGETEDSLLEAFQKLSLEQNVSAIIGPITSKDSEFVFERAQILGVPVVSLAPRENLEMYGAYSFRSALTLRDQIDGLASFIRNDLRASRAAILFPDSNYGWDAVKIAEDQFPRRGIEINEIQVYEEKATDFKEQLKKITRLDFPKVRASELCPKESEADPAEEGDLPESPQKPAGCVEELDQLPPIFNFEVLFVPDFADTVGLLLPTLPFLRIYGIQVVGLSGYNSSKIIERGQQHTEGVIFTDGFYAGSDDLKTRFFIERYKSLSGKQPNKVAAEAFDVAMLLVKLMKDLQGSVTRRQVLFGLQDVRNFEGVTGKLYSDGQQIRKEANLFILRDKRVQPLR